MDDAMKIAVAMNPELAVLLHDPGVRYIVGDITFKRTKGEFNEWEAVIWYAETFKRLTVVRIYINMATTEAFVHLFDAFFTTVKQVTGKSVRFKVFYEKGNIYSIHFDMEAAQVQGLGVALSKMVLNDSDLLLRFPDHTSENIVQYILKLCSVHFERSTDALVAVVGQEVVNYLNNFRGLSDPTDIENWHNFSRTHENKKLRGQFVLLFIAEVSTNAQEDWYAHKIQYPWMLPGFNESLSRFPSGYWQQSPNHTNLVESAHVASNRATSINLPLLESIRG
ncbi:hypothetical protein K438DRAFT_1976795 [Mycena galopus ATCC 62051]|nr:hypothetical protein K438DRAFT_1976795 [Mycena galopus ATCC 62051]